MKETYRVRNMKGEPNQFWFFMKKNNQFPIFHHRDENTSSFLLCWFDPKQAPQA